MFCLPTFYEAETFGIVLVEAMSLGLPVVATRWRGIPEIVDDGKTGYLVETHDAAAVAERLEQLQADPALREQLGAAGREKFLSDFTVGKILAADGTSVFGNGGCVMGFARLTQRFSQLRRHPGYRHNPPVVLGRAAAWSLHCLLGIPARPEFRRWNYRLYLPAKWRGGGSTSPYLFREHYEPELMLLERFLKPGMVFVDGGANTGVFTFTAARLVGPTGRVLAFEPGAACFAALEASRALNQFEQVRLWKAALSDRSGTARLYHCWGQENAFSLGAGRKRDVR